MNDNQSIFLLEVKPFFTEESGRILSELLGIKTKVLVFGEEKPVTPEILQEMYHSPIISIMIDCPHLGSELIVVMEQSSLLHLLNYRIDGAFLTGEDEERIENEAIQFVHEYIDQFVMAFSEKIAGCVKFTPSVQFRYVDSNAMRDDVTSYTRMDINVIIDGDFSGRMIALLSPGMVAKYMKNRNQFRQCINQSYSQKTDLSSEVSFIGSPVRNLRNQGNISMLLNLELPIAIELGQVRMMVKDILELEPGKVVELNKYLNEPVDIYLNHKKFAEGEVIFIDHNFGVKITALIGPNERLSHL